MSLQLRAELSDRTFPGLSLQAELNTTLMQRNSSTQKPFRIPRMRRSEQRRQTHSLTRREHESSASLTASGATGVDHLSKSQVKTSNFRDDLVPKALATRGSSEELPGSMCKALGIRSVKIFRIRSRSTTHYASGVLFRVCFNSSAGRNWTIQHKSKAERRSSI